MSTRVNSGAAVIATVLLMTTLGIGLYSQMPKKTTRIENVMESCLHDEKPKARGEAALDATYRLCWMRAKREASKPE